ncbi:MAG: phenylalanine--tRNA ligase subunit alpha [Nanoarchaeota archaeon]
MSKELVKKLHPHEKKILLVLKKLSKADVKTIAKESKLAEKSLHKTAHWTEVKGLTKHEQSVKKKLELTAEGKKYLKEGLPEKKLLEKIYKKPIAITELKSIPNFNIALAWAKRMGWVIFTKGKLHITQEGKKALGEETSIEKVMKTGEGKDSDFKDLEKRKLAKIKEIKTKTYELTKKGKEILPYVSDTGDETNLLTMDDIKTGDWKKKNFRAYDVNTPVPKIYPAKLHPYTVFLNDMKKKLITLGFQEMRGPFVELAFWNFDALFMPQDHPARGIHDIYEMKTPSKGVLNNERVTKRVEMVHKNGWITGSSGWGNWNKNKATDLVLRSQTTAVSARTLASGIKPPEKFFTISRNFRPDVLDAKHLIEFNHCEGIVIAEKLTFKHLLGYLEKFASMVGIDKVRFKPGYFPFTEPSVEMFGNHPKLGWIELGGAGMFRPEVTKPLGVECPVLAWGLGIDRLAMINLGINDIRQLFSSDLELLRTSKVI